MADAIAVVGLVASVLTLIDTGKSFLTLVQDLRQNGCEISDAIADAEAQIPLLIDLVKHLQDQDALKQRDSSEQSNLLVAINGCNRQIRLLTDIIASTNLRGQPISAITATRTIWRRLRSRKDVHRIQQALEHYKTLLTLKMMQDAQDQDVKSEEGGENNAAKYFQIPSVSLSKFVGRRKALEEIHSSWKYDSKKPSSLSDSTTVILGMGGQGKTQVAQEYCRFARRTKTFEAIFWLNASSSDLIVRSYTDLAVKLAHGSSKVSHSEKSSTDFVMRTISKLRVRWLVVLDNFDDPKTFRNITDYLPPNPDGFGAFLFTSRHQDVSSLGTTVFLNGMTKDEGVELFFHRLGRDSSLVSHDQASIIVARMGGLPLAIDQVASYMRRHRLDLESFDRILESQSSTLKLWSAVPHTWGYYKEKDSERADQQVVELKIATTFDLSLQQIETDDSSRGRVGAMLSFLSLFDGDCISEELAIAARESTGETAECMQICYEDGKWNKLKFQDILVELYGLSLLETIDFGNEYATLTLHPMVLEWLRIRIAPDQRACFSTMAISVIDTLLRDCSETLDSMKLQRREWLLSNSTSARTSARYLNGDTSVLCSMSREAASRFADFYMSCERLDTAMELYDTLLALAADDAPSVEKFQLYHDAASCLVEKSRYSEAEELYSKALEGKTTLLGPDHESTLRSAQKLGMTYRRSLHYAEGEKIIRHVVERARAVHGEDTSLYLVSLNTLAVNLRYQKHLVEAEVAARAAFDGVLKNFGRGSYMSFFIGRSLGLVLRDQGRLVEAEKMLRGVLESQEKVLGTLNSSTLFTGTILEGIYERLGDDAQVQYMRNKMHGDLGRAIFRASSWSTDR
ncbi:hypothetical protein GGS24DRAFT_374695 [Hypoxylon argillaceum]|nr:hypothetical protein GGS24DRAFT_374695 [Hypoxylon argillaceum]